MSTTQALLTLKDNLTLLILTKAASRAIDTVLSDYDIQIARAFRNSLTPVERASLLNTHDIFHHSQAYQDLLMDLKKLVIKELHGD